MHSPSNLGYIVAGVSALHDWKRFLIDTIGLQVGQQKEKDYLALRIDDAEQRILLTQTGEDDLIAAGWQFDTSDELSVFLNRLRKTGISIHQAQDEERQSRRVAELYWCLSPEGVRHEFYTNPTWATAKTPFHSPLMKAGFVAGRLGVGHIVMVTQNRQESINFCTDALGLRVSDYIQGEIAPGKVLDAAFYHARTGRHHSIATVDVPFPYDKRLHHFMLEMASANDVGLAYDRCLAAGYTITSHLGHHPNDDMFSFYVATPSGFLLEIGAGGRVVDSNNWEVKTYSQLSDWGHHKNLKHA